MVPLSSTLTRRLVDMWVSALNVDFAGFGRVDRRTNLEVMGRITNVLGAVDCFGCCIEDRVERRAAWAVGGKGRVRICVRARCWPALELLTSRTTKNVCLAGSGYLPVDWNLTTGSC